MTDLEKHGPRQPRHPTSSGSSINCLELPFPCDTIICIQTISLLPVFHQHIPTNSTYMIHWKQGGAFSSQCIHLNPSQASPLELGVAWWLWSTDINPKCRAWLTLSGTRSKENPHRSWQRHRWVSVYLNVKRGFTWWHYVSMTGTTEFSVWKVGPVERFQRPGNNSPFWNTATTSALCYEHGVAQWKRIGFIFTPQDTWDAPVYCNCKSWLQVVPYACSRWRIVVPTCSKHHLYQQQSLSWSFHSHGSHDSNQIQKEIDLGLFYAFLSAKWMPSDNCCTPSSLDERRSPPHAPRSLPLAYHKQHTSVRWTGSRIHLRVSTLDPIWRMVSNK